MLMQQELEAGRGVAGLASLIKPLGLSLLPILLVCRIEFTEGQIGNAIDLAF
jgi:hypothetical protein